MNKIETMWSLFGRLALSICLVAISRPGLAADADNCMEIQNNGARLQCYDALDSAKIATTATMLSRRWELEPDTKLGLWSVLPYRPMFILPVRYTSNTNDTPQTPSEPTLPAPVPLDKLEAEIQLSFKTKAAENLFGSQSDLWFAYTQQSQWQVYNGQISRPFRETNYQPEFFVVIPTHYDLFGLTGRFVDLGLVHQSNGRANPISRSWNRFYAAFAFERGNFALIARPWYRFKEDPASDNNPDITDYMGHGDVTAIYLLGKQEFSLTGRLNVRTGYGAAEGTWSFPIHQRLKGFVKLFTGYGETMIDYNWNQTSIGIGVQLGDWR